MANYELNLRDYLRILRKHRLYFVVPPIALAALTYLLTPTPPVSYEARASVKFSQSSTLAGLMLQVFTYSPGDNIATQTRILTSLPLMARLAQYLGKAPSDLDHKELIEHPDHVAVVADLQSRVSAEPVGNTNIIEISAHDSSRHEAIAIVNGLADVFASWSLEERNRQVMEAKEFIGDQLAEAESRLKSTEDELRRFMEKNLDRLSLSADELSRLQQERERVRRLIETLELQVEQLETRRDEGEGQIDWISSHELNDTNLERFNNELIDLQLEKERLLVYQTESSPEVKALESKIQTLLTSLTREYQATLTELRREQRELNEKIAVIPQNDAELNRLRRDQQVANDAYTMLKAKYEEAVIREAEKIREVDVVEYATGATARSRPGKLSKTLIGGLVGLMLGFIFTLIAENMDTSIATIEDVEGFLQLPVLGVIPQIDRDAVQRALAAENPDASPESLASYAGLVAQFDPASPVAEAYRSLRTNLEFSRMGQPATSFVVTSSTLEEGKSTTVANLALAFSQSGKRTLVVESDLRRPSIHAQFGLARDPGLSEVLLGTLSWQEALRSVADLFLGKLDMDTLVRTPGLDNLFFITSGTLPPNPAELLGSAPMKNFVEEVGSEFDVVLFDTPPVLPVTDAAILASAADGVLLVYQAGRAGRGVLKRAKSHLESVRADIRGVILNNITAEVSEFSPAEHHYSYYAEYKNREDEDVPRGVLGRMAARVRGASKRSDERPSPSMNDGGGPPAETRPGARGGARGGGGNEYSDLLDVTGSGERSREDER